MDTELNAQLSFWSLSVLLRGAWAGRRYAKWSVIVTGFRRFLFDWKAWAYRTKWAVTAIRLQRSPHGSEGRGVQGERARKYYTSPAVASAKREPGGAK